MCQKYVKKGYMEMGEQLYLEPWKSVLGRSILHYCYCHILPYLVGFPIEWFLFCSDSLLQCFFWYFFLFLDSSLLELDVGWTFCPLFVDRRCSVKKVEAEACNFIKKETLAQVFSCEFCEISKKTYYYKTTLVVASFYNLK